MHKFNNVRRKAHRRNGIHSSGAKSTTQVDSTQAQHRERDGWKQEGRGGERGRERIVVN